MLYIDGANIEDYGGKLMSDYSVGSTPITTSYHQGKNRTSYTMISTEIGLKLITLPIMLRGHDRADVMAAKSKVDSMLYGKKVELLLPDNYYYTSVLMESDCEYISENLVKVTYELEGMQHGDMITVTGNHIYCPSTTKKTDCIIRATARSSGDCHIGDAVFHGMQAGYYITFDGINKRILINNSDQAHRCEWTDFPSLTPGWNDISTDAAVVTIQFYPCYL